MLSIYAHPVYDAEEQNAIQEYAADLANNWLGESRQAGRLEKLISETIGVPHAVVTNTGTAALLAGYQAIGLAPGDDVLVSAYTFVATASPVRFLGATVKLVDIEPDTLGMSVDSLRRALTPQTKCVALAPINGRHPEGLREIVDLCRERTIWLLEDCASAFGSTKFGQPVGSWGDWGITSFSTAKVVSSGQGGAFFTRHQELAERVRRFKNFGRSKSSDDIFDSLGLNFKLSDINSVVAMVQIRKLAETSRRKRAVFERYMANLGRDAFPATDFIEHKTTYVDFMGARGRRDALKEFLGSHGIGTRILYPSLNQHPLFAEARGETPVAQKRCSDGLLLPSAADLTTDDVDRVSRLVREFLAR